MTSKKSSKGAKRKIMRSDGRIQVYRIKNLKKFNETHKKKKGFFEKIIEFILPEPEMPEILEEQQLFTEKELYRSTITFLYSDKKQRKEEFRITIYTEEPIITPKKLRNIMQKYFDDEEFNIDWNEIIGEEINNPVDSEESNKLNNYHCVFIKFGKIIKETDYEM